VRFPVSILQKSWFLAGPTASGKTAVGISLARQIGAEIVCLDSMTVYRGMDIGTAKPSPAERAAVPHHLLDLREPHEEFSTAEFLAAALEACHAILRRDRVPLFVGGTGLYLRSLLRGVFEGPSANWDLRREWEQFTAQHGAAALHAELARIDPPTAKRLHPNDQRRVIRALEIHALTGRPASEQLQETPLPPDQRPQHVYWLNPDREQLRQRIDLRIDTMIAAGLVDEVRGLLQAPQGLGRTARQALGYREILAHLEDGLPLSEAIDQLKTHTHQFAKRQYTWFRNLEELTPVDLRGDESADQVGEQILKLANHKQ
jgi:tRNA dimethylallyltransferase